MLGVWFCVLQTARNKSLIVKDIVFLVSGSLFGVLSIGVWMGLMSNVDLPAWVLSRIGRAEGRLGGPQVLDCVFTWAGVVT